ncbi:MAG: hypothetical protein AAF289_03840 [Cyanobacteria bacterium P01_A01_bin.135]
MTYSAELHSASDSHAYRQRLNHWAVVRLLPNMQRSVLTRFRTRSDADGHLTFLRNHMPQSQFQVVFDPLSIGQSDS